MMKKNCCFALILISVLCLTFCGCDLSKMSPWADKITNNNSIKTKTYAVYVYGAVQNEGYYEMENGDTYFYAISKAGLLEQSWLPTNVNSLVNDQQLSIAVQYKEDGIVYDCISVNHQFILMRYSVPGLSDDVVNNIADYYEIYGKITNKTVLRAVLGDDDYENYHYKLFIAETDYEETN